LGNDFVVVDSTQVDFCLSAAEINALADRKRGVGFDQLLVLQKSTDEDADFIYRIFNADGSEVDQCGNGARCIALYIKERGLSQKHELKLKTKSDILKIAFRDDQFISVNMGVPCFVPAQIPFCAKQEQLIYSVCLESEEVEVGVVNVGNPHAVLLVDEFDNEHNCELAEQLAKSADFPEGVNVGLMRVLNEDCLQLQVYERGVGFTDACGSGACAAMIIAKRLGLVRTEVKIIQPGGELVISWQEDGWPVMMTGSAHFVFHGQWLGNIDN